MLESLRIHAEVVRRSLMEFHKVPAREAGETVARLYRQPSEIMLHAEPYVVAFELQRGSDFLSREQYAADRKRAKAIWDEAKAELEKEKAKGVGEKRTGRVFAGKKTKHRNSPKPLRVR